MHESTSNSREKDKAMWGTSETIQQYSVPIKTPPLLNQHNTTFVVDIEGWVDHVDVPENGGSSQFQIALATKRSLLHGAP